MIAKFAAQTQASRQGGALPLPACGESVGVRGSLNPRGLYPLTRTASRSDLSPQAGRGETRAVLAFRQPLLIRFTMSNSHAKSAAAFGRPRGGRLVSPAVARRVFALEDRGAERRVAPPVKCARLGGRARPFGEGTLRPSALRAAVYGLRGRASADRAFPALALGVAIITVANGSREGRSAPGAIPVPPEGRACKARRAGAAPRSAFRRLRRRPRMSGVVGPYT